MDKSINSTGPSRSKVVRFHCQTRKYSLHVFAKVLTNYVRKAKMSTTRSIPLLKAL